MKKKLLALLLTGVTILGTLPISAKAALAEDYDLAVHYDMSHNGTQLTDQSGNNNHGVLHNISDSDFKEEAGDAILEFPGGDAGADGPYVDLPLSIKDSLTNYKSNFSVEMTLMPRTAQFQFLWTIGTGDATDYLFFNPRLGDSKINVATKTQGAGGIENAVPGMNTVTLDTQKFSIMTVTSEGQRLKVYINGELIGTLDHNHNLDEIFGGNGVLGYLAKSNWGGDRYSDAVVSDFKIYNQTLTDSQVKTIYTESAVYTRQMIQEDMEAMNPGNLSAVVGDLNLPKTGDVNGSVITWKSSATDVIANDGKVTPGNADTKVNLTATFTLNGMSLEKTYTANVVRKDGVADVILNQYLILPYYMTANDTLPLEIMSMPVKWESDCEDIDVKTGKITPSKTGLTDVSLTAEFSVGGQTLKKEFKVKLMGKDSAYVLSYTRQVDSSKNGMYNEFVTSSMHLGYSADGTDYRALLNNTGILFAKAQGAVTKFLKEPYIFRMKDGSFGVLAVRVEEGQTVADAAGTLLFFTSDDLISYEEVGMIRLSNTEHISSPACMYDAVKDSYYITWTSAETGEVYANETADFKTFTTAEPSVPIQNSYVKTDIPYAIPGNVLGVTAAEKAVLLNKLEKVVNTTVENPTITVKPGEVKELKDTKVTANYSDGSSAEKTVMWNQSELNQVDFNKEGTYTVTGTIKQISDETKDNYPFLADRADPNIVQYNGKYYFVSTTEANSNGNIYIREADRVTELNKVQQHLIFDAAKGTAYGYDTPFNHWAPELHVVNGELCLFFTTNHGSGFNVQSMFMKLTGTDPTNYNDWGDLHRFLNKDGEPLAEPYGGITLDMTHFSYDGRDYVVWAQRNFGVNGGTSDLWIGEIDKNKPYQLISDAVKILDCEYGWERNHTFVIEGPFVIIRDDKMYLTYSGGATDETYCVGMASIDLNDDFMDKSAWKKSNYPVLTGLSVEGYNGPGHNSYVQDSDGNLINVFHGRGDSSRFQRDTFLRIVHFGVDDAPILDMTEEREILPENKKVTMTVVVKEDIPERPFVDVDKETGNWYYDAVYYNYDRKIINGVNPTHFEPLSNLARAQFAIILHNMEGKPAVAYEPKFKDVAEGQWYTNAILWASSKEIVTGYTDGSEKFGWGDNILREQMAVMMYRYAKNFKKYDVSDSANFDSFTDAALVNDYAKEAMKWAVGTGIITGKDNGTRLDPLGNASRAECAIIIQRFLEKYDK